MIGFEIFRTWAVSGNTATADTAFYRLVEPYPGTGAGGRPLHRVDGNGKRVQPAPGAFTHVSSLIYTAGTTAHDVVVLRPLNWTYLTEAAGVNDTTVVIADDPGVYSTNYRYPLSGAVTKPTSVADNAIAANDYVAFQRLDGTWHVSTVASVSGLTVTLNTATPNVTGAGAAKYAMVYFFGVAADVNPQTGLAHLAFKSTASTKVEFFAQNGSSSACGLNPYDPLIIYSGNATAAGTLNAASGFYANR